MSTSLIDALTALTARIESYGENAREYDVLRLLDAFPSAEAVTTADEREFLLALTQSLRQEQTDAPCPPWCRYAHGHVFESETADGKQSRFHSFDIEAPAKVDLSIVREETRAKGNDGTVAGGTPTIWLTVDRDDLTSEGARKIAAALLNAADKLDEITGG